jgi:hypothetical protein
MNDSKRMSDWLTIKLLSQEEPSFSEASLRNLVFKANNRKSSLGLIPGNGLAPHVRRIGRKVLISRKGFLEWVSGGGK